MNSNLTSFKGSTQSFGNNNEFTGTGFAYDWNGNPTTYKGATLTFDAENRLTAYGSLMTAGYRADNLRAWKGGAGGANRTYYYYAGGNTLFETNASGGVTAINVFVPDGLVARQSGGVWTYYDFDPQGNVLHRLNSSGPVTSTTGYDAYGALTSGAAGDPFGYNGRWGYYTDAETGLCYCQNRYYDPAKGRWLTRDPIGFGGGMNVYGYVAQTPLGSADSAGLEDYEFTWKVGKLVNNSKFPIRFLFDLGHGTKRRTYFIDLPPGYETTEAVDADWVSIDQGWGHILGAHQATVVDLRGSDGVVCGQKVFFPTYPFVSRASQVWSAGLPPGFESTDPKSGKELQTAPHRFPHPEKEQPKRRNGSTIPLIRPIPPPRRTWFSYF